MSTTVKLNTTQQELVKDYMPLANKIAVQSYKEFRQVACNADIEDIRSEAYMGLMTAALTYDTNKETSFSAFARHRIRGAIIDYLRRSDNLSRGHRKFVKLAAAAEMEGKPLSTEDAAQIIGVSEKSIKRYSRTTPSQCSETVFVPDSNETVSLFETIEDSSLSVEEMVENSELIAELFSSDKLTANEKTALRLYHLEGIPQKEVARRLGVTPPRVSQILAQAVTKAAAVLK